MLVTKTESAIVVKEVSSRFFVISPIPFRRLAVLKYRSIWIRSALSCDKLNDLLDAVDEILKPDEEIDDEEDWW